jgi:hypothetical protein
VTAAKDAHNKKSLHSASGLPDGIFSNQNPNFDIFLEGLAMKSFGTSGIFNVHLVHFMSIWYIL